MFNYLKDLLGVEPAAPSEPGQPRAKRSRGTGRAPLPEVSEVDWSEWESSMLMSELDALLAQSEPLPAAATDGPEPAYAKVSAPPEVREVEWSEWEDSVLDAGKRPRAKPSA
jgi:hypothetical protein